MQGGSSGLSTVGLGADVEAICERARFPAQTPRNGGGHVQEAGQIVGIFPEGHLTHDGEVDVFRSGIEKIIERTPVPVVPMALQGLWGSFFSNCGGPALTHAPRFSWSRLGFVVGQPVAPDQVKAEDLRERVLALRGDRR